MLDNPNYFDEFADVETELGSLSDLLVSTTIQGFDEEVSLRINAKVP